MVKCFGELFVCVALDEKKKKRKESLSETEVVFEKS